MKKGRFGKTRNPSNHRNIKQKEVTQIMRKDRGKTSWMSVIAMVVAVMAASLLLTQVAGAVTFTITASAGSGGTIAPSGSVSVVAGTAKIFTITPNSKKAITKLTVDNIDVQPARTYKFTTVSANHTINVTFATDSDNDGISDDLEQAGITVWGITYPPCPRNVPAADRPSCVDKDSKDVFVVLVQASGGYFSGLNNPLEYVTKSVSAGGLPITVHWKLLSADQSDRFLSPNSAQKYVRITESLDTNTGDVTVLGSSTTGTPDQDLGAVYTKRIVNHVNSVNPGASSDFINKYFRHTIAHELAHMVGPLTPVYNTNFGGYHNQPLPNDLIMNQFVYHDDTGGSPVFYIGTSFTSADQAGIILK